MTASSATAPPRTTTRSRVIACVAVLVVATVVALLIGLDDRSAGDRRGVDRVVTATLGEPVAVGAVTVTVESIEAAEQWPDRSELGPSDPVVAVEGAVVVVVRYRVTRAAELEVSCTAGLVADPATDPQEWEPQPYGDRLAGPDGLSYCSEPVAGPGEGEVVTQGFEVPARYADRVAAAVDVDGTRVLVAR